MVSAGGAAMAAAFIAGAVLGFWPQLDDFATAALGDAAFDVVLSTL